MAKTTKPTKKTSAKPVTKAKLRVHTVPVTPAAEKAKKTVHSVSSDMSVAVMGTDGKVSGKMTLPKELFAVVVNQQLLAQSVRVHLANQRSGQASTKTRGEVEGSTRKIYKQKGTGKARHGGIRAPVFVGGGIAFGPKPQDHSLIMPQKMRRLALASALTSMFASGNILFVDGLSDLPPKTKDMAKSLRVLGIVGRALLITPDNTQQVIRAARNIASLDIIGARSIYPYALLSHPRIVMMKEAVHVLSQTFIKTKPS